MKAKKLLRKSMNNSIAEYNRIHAILYPNSESAQLTSEQYERLDLAGIDSIMVELAAERDRILLEQSKRELSIMYQNQPQPAQSRQKNTNNPMFHALAAMFHVEHSNSEERT